MKSIVLNILIFLNSFLAFSQINQGGTPHSWEINDLKELEMHNLQSTKNEFTKVNTDRIHSGAFEFAKLINANINMYEKGTWNNLPNGDKVWRIQLKSKGAFSLNILFSEFVIPIGAKVFIYSPNREMVLGAFTSENNKKSGKLATIPLSGDELIVEYYQPKNAEFDGILTIGNVGHDYVNAFRAKDGNFGRSGNCNIDINCMEGDNWQIEKHAVCRMIVSGKWLCTGTLINNAKEDEAPFVLTANHCIEYQDKAENTIFLFNYESPWCKGPDGNVSQTISGCDLIATKNKGDGYLDFTLVKLSKNVPVAYKPFFAGWDSRQNFPKNSTGIHHPWGDVKKISLDNDAPLKANYDEFGYDKQTFWKVLEWDAGTTEGGSSGSSMFDQNHRIVGTLTGGEASCENSVNDLYQMFAASYASYSTDTNQLKKWLDPNNTGISYLDGYNPYDVAVKETDCANEIKVYPSPASQSININIPIEYNATLFTIYNNIGQIVYISNEIEQQNTTIDIFNWQNGFYFIKIETIDKVKVSEFIINH